MWNSGRLAPGRCTVLFQTNDAELRFVGFSPDDQTLAAVGMHGLIHLINRSTGVRESIASGHDRLWCVAYSPDGRTLATTSGLLTVKLWDLERDRARISIPIPTALTSSLAFSTDGATISVADDRGRVWVCDGARGFPLDREFLQRRLSHSQRGLARCPLTGDRGRVRHHHLMGTTQRSPPGRLYDPACIQRLSGGLSRWTMGQSIQSR